MLWAAAPAAADEPPPSNLYQDALQALFEGHRDESRQILQRLVESEPQHAGAWLDLAILQCGLGNATEANVLFRAIEQRFSPPPAILEVIALQRAQGCSALKPEEMLRLRLGRGTDSNVNQGTSNPNFTLGSGTSVINLVLAPEYAPQKDSFTALSADYLRTLSTAGTIGFVQFQLRQYDTLHRFDLGSLTAGVEYPWRIGQWNLKGSASAGITTLDGTFYQWQGQSQVQATAPLPWSKGWEAGVGGGWTHLSYSTMSQFNSDVWEVRGLLHYRTTETFAQASVGYAFDRGSPLRPGNDRQGMVSSLSARTRLYQAIFGEVGWTYQGWYGQTPYSPGIIDQHRNQRTSLLRTAVAFPFTKRQSMHLEYRNVRNMESISLFEYRQHVLQLSWQWQTGP